MKNVIIHIVLFLFFYGSLFSQTFSFRHFTVNDGLPSSYIYDLAQDKDGFIWIATESGISKYDGVEFDNNPIPEIQQEEIVNLKFDSQNRLWMNSLNGQIIYHENDSTYRIKDIGHDYNGTFINAQIKKIFEDDLGRIWLIDLVNYGYRIDSLSQSKVLGLKKVLFQTNSAQYFHSYGDTTLFVGAKGIHFIVGEGLTYRKYDQETNQTHILNGFIKEGKVIFSSPTKINSYDLSTHEFSRVLAEYDEYFKTGIYNIHLDKNDNFWISTSNGVFFLQKTIYGKYEIHHLLEGILMGQILEDKDGNIWFTSLREGIFFLPSYRINVLNKESGLSSNRITCISNNQNNEIVLGTDENYINTIAFDKNEKPYFAFKDKITKRAREIYDIIDHDSGNIWYISSSGVYEYDINKKSIKKKSNSPHALKVGRQANDGSVWLGSGTTVLRIEQNEKKEEISTVILKERTYAIAPINRDSAWIGSVMGLYFYSKEDSIKIVDIPELQTDIRDLRFREDGTLWIATKSSGIYLFKNGKIINHIDQDDGLPSNSCKRIFLDEKYAWVATNSGIVRISYTDFSLMTIDINDGLPSREINDITKLDNKIYLATNNGVAYFNEDIKTKDNAPNLFIKSIRINERDTALLSSYTLKHTDTNIKASFVGLAYQSSKDISYRVKMEGLDKNWLEINTGIAEYPSLSSGKYTLRIQSKTSNSEWSDEKAIEFFINSPYWKKWWFIGLSILFFIFLFFFIFNLMINRYKRKNEIQEKLKESRLTALRSQMNPHFMFNSLNSIQEFILKQDKRSANKYLSKFSLLMRNILDMSDKNRIPLEQEISALRIYLELEALRFDNNIFYAINVNDEIDPKGTMIPSMLIQPYVENAIKHGLMHKKENRRINISFVLKGNYLICEVDDNGIGRKQANNIRSLNKKSHHPKAMSVTEERLKLLNSAFQDDLNVEIIDKINKDDGTSEGTKVIIHIEQKSYTNQIS